MATLTVLSKDKIYGPTKENPKIALTYPRLVEIEHYEGEEGTLLVTGESLDINGYRIHRSRDGGKSWEHIATVTETMEPDLIANWQPHLYELPKKVGEMPKGTLILSGCTRDLRVERITKMCLWRSFDCGKSWEEFSVVAVGGDIHCGLYEPFCILSDDGRLFCFYSDETHPDHSQMLVCKYSHDGVNWSDRILVVACKERHLRPGMISIARQGNGLYALAYEMVAEKGHPIYVKTSERLDDWGDPSEIGYKVVSKTQDAPSCTPYIAWLPAGGECGTLVVASWHLASFEEGKGSDLYVSFDYGKTWETVENPLPFVWPAKHRYSYSPTLVKGSRDDILYYINAVECEDKEFSPLADFVLCTIKIGE